MANVSGPTDVCLGSIGSVGLSMGVLIEKLQWRGAWKRVGLERSWGFVPTVLIFVHVSQHRTESCGPLARGMLKRDDGGDCRG